MPSKRVHIFVFFSFFILVSPLVNSSYAETGKGYAASVVSQGEKAIEVAFVSLTAAEKVGANVSELSIALNNDLDSLLQAERALQLGDYDAAAIWAGNAADGANKVIADAGKLKTATEDRSKEDLRNGLMITFGLDFCIVVLGYGVWRWLRDYDTRKTMRMRPEV